MVGPQLSAVPWFDSGGWARMSDEHERALARLLATTDRLAASRAQARAAYEKARNVVLSASELSSTGRTTPSDHPGACGHELDRWESHLEHHPECPADGSPCTCPEVCPACCGGCS